MNLLSVSFSKFQIIVPAVIYFSNLLAKFFMITEEDFLSHERPCDKSFHFMCGGGGEGGGSKGGVGEAVQLTERLLLWTDREGILNAWLEGSVEA